MSLLNKSQVRRFALETAADQRFLANGYARFIRVSPSLYDELEALVRAAIRARIHSAPSKGRTLK